MKNIFISMVCVFIFVMPAAWADHKLSGSQIRHLFSGKTYLSKKSNGGPVIKIFSSSNGNMILTDVTGNQHKMKWSVRGNKHCDNRVGRLSCGEIVSQGDGVYYKLSGNRLIPRLVDGNHIVYHLVKNSKHNLKISGFTSGNQL